MIWVLLIIIRIVMVRTDTPLTIIPRDPRTVWSESVQDFQNFVGPGPVPGFEIFLGPGPVRSQISKFFLVLVRSGPRVWNFLDPGPVRSQISKFLSRISRIFSVLVQPGPTFLNSVRDQPVLVRGSLILPLNSGPEWRHNDVILMSVPVYDSYFRRSNKLYYIGIIYNAMAYIIGKKSRTLSRADFLIRLFSITGMNKSCQTFKIFQNLFICKYYK